MENYKNVKVDIMRDGKLTIVMEIKFPKDDLPQKGQILSICNSDLSTAPYTDYWVTDIVREVYYDRRDMHIAGPAYIRVVSVDDCET